MTKLEIAQRIAGNHNRLTNILVSGDNAILMGETLKDLRSFVQELQQNIEEEAQAEERAKAEKGGKPEE